MLPETFIAKRLGIRGSSSGVMLRVAVFSIAVSLTVMILALSVVAGFRNEIGEKVAGFAAHLQITALGSGHSYENLPVAYRQGFVAGLEGLPGVKHVQRFAAKAGILRSDSTIQGILLKGIGPEYDLSFLRKQLVEGDIPAYSDTARNRDAVISRTLAEAMNLEMDDRFEVLFVGGDRPRRDRLRVAGIYSSGMEEFDRLMVIGDISVVQRLNGWNRDEISGYEIVAAAGLDSEAIEEIAYEIAGQTWPEVFPGWGDPLSQSNTNLEITTVRDRFPQIFEWLEMLGLNTTIVIIIMLIVAVVNMISGVLIVVLEQTRTIGILKALGMPGAMLQRIFILRTATITLRGMLWGNIVGLGLCLLQQSTGWLSLDPENYMIAMVPVHVEWYSVLLLNLGTFAVITGMMTLPTLIISRITPDKAIRFQ